MALGTNILLSAELGMPPWDLLHLGLSQHLPLSYGRVIQMLGLLCVLGGYLLKVKPSLGTLLNMFFVGFWVDLFLEQGIIPSPGSVAVQLIYLVGGIAVFSYGTALYISMNRGTGPRDSLMMGLCRITGKRIGVIRGLMEVTVTISGALLGGPLGIGTLVFAFSVGFCLEACFLLVKWQVYLKHKAWDRFKKSFTRSSQQTSSECRQSARP